MFFKIQVNVQVKKKHTHNIFVTKRFVIKYKNKIKLKREFFSK